MKKIFYLLLAATLTAGCGSDDDEAPKPEIEISLSQSAINIPVKGTADISVIGIDPDDAEIKVADKFVADAYNYDGKIHIQANHVGSTKVVASYEGKTAECVVKVTALNDYLGDPVLDFGASREEVKAKAKGKIIEEDDNRIEFFYDGRFPVYTTYHFSNDKMECVFTALNIRTDPSYILNSLMERYNLLSYSSGSYWFEYPTKFVVQENEQRANGGFHVRYAKDRETMAKYYQV